MIPLHLKKNITTKIIATILWLSTLCILPILLEDYFSLTIIGSSSNVARRIMISSAFHFAPTLCIICFSVLLWKFKGKASYSTSPQHTQSPRSSTTLSSSETEKRKKFFSFSNGIFAKLIICAKFIGILYILSTLVGYYFNLIIFINSPNAISKVVTSPVFLCVPVLFIMYLCFLLWKRTGNAFHPTRVRKQWRENKFFSFVKGIYVKLINIVIPALMAATYIIIIIVSLFFFLEAYGKYHTTKSSFKEIYNSQRITIKRIIGKQKPLLAYRHKISSYLNKTPSLVCYIHIYKYVSIDYNNLNLYFSRIENEEDLNQNNLTYYCVYSKINIDSKSSDSQWVAPRFHYINHKEYLIYGKIDNIKADFYPDFSNHKVLKAEHSDDIIIINKEMKTIKVCRVKTF